MQKQKTIAKWLAIIILCSVAVGSYLLYDALYVKKSNSQATADDAVSPPSNVEDEDDKVEDVTPPYVPYYTTLPRPYEVIEGIGVTHFGGESDDRVHAVHNLGGKRMAIFSSNSVEYDMRQTGLSVAVIDGGVEAVKHLGEGQYLDGVLSGSGLLILAKGEYGGRVLLLNEFGEIRGQITLPEILDGELYLSHGEVMLFYVAEGRIYAVKILDSLMLQSSPFMIKTDCDDVKAVFDTPLGQGIIVGTEDTTKIYTFEHNKGFNLSFSQDKLLFKQIITAGSNADCNYVLYGNSDSTPTLVAFDVDFQIVGVRAVDGATDGVILPYGDGVTFVGNGVSATFCKHLDKIGEGANDLTFEEVVVCLPTRDGFVLAVKGLDGLDVVLADGEILKKKHLDFEGNIAGFVDFGNGFSILVNTRSNLGIFRGNFGGVEPYILDFDLSCFEGEV